MAWAAFDAHGTFSLQLITSRMNSEVYQHVLGKENAPSFASNLAHGFCFLQNHASIMLACRPNSN